jgi:hypothetical protein
MEIGVDIIMNAIILLSSGVIDGENRCRLGKEETECRIDD